LNSKDRDLADSTHAIDALKSSLTQALTVRDLNAQKSEFLNSYVLYLKNPRGDGKKLFKDVVCSMWKESESRRIQICQEPVAVSLNDVQRGLDPDTKS
jgi:hypothetical protein